MGSIESVAAFFLEAFRGKTTHGGNFASRAMD
jgi:hypothetical protein